MAILGITEKTFMVGKILEHIKKTIIACLCFILTGCSFCDYDKLSAEDWANKSNELEYELKQAKNALDESNNQIDDLNSEIEELESQLDEKDNLISNMENEYSSKENEFKKNMECNGYLADLKAEHEGGSSGFLTEIREIFYSPKQNSCLYVLTLIHKESYDYMLYFRDAITEEDIYVLYGNLDDSNGELEKFNTLVNSYK